LRPGTLGELSGTIKSFDQNRYTGRDIADALSMGDEGYVFVPSACEQGAACRVHVALHGCEQDVGTIGRRFIEQTGYTGYNAWADANRIIVLYPQAKSSPFLPYNPKGCWDWWSYINHEDGYVTKAGLQIAAIKAMLDALTAGGASPAPLPEQGDAPAELVVTDTSDTAAALAWTPVAGASRYRVWRAAGADGVFSPAGERTGRAMAITGWRLRRPIPGRSPQSSMAASAHPRPVPALRRGRAPCLAKSPGPVH
jgi:hypothetical protein